MSYWHNEVILHDKDKDITKHWYGLHEVWFENDKIVAHTEEPLYFAVGEDEGPEELIRSMELALLDIKKHPIRKESEIVFSSWESIEKAKDETGRVYENVEELMKDLDNDDKKLPDSPS